MSAVLALTEEWPPALPESSLLWPEPQAGQKWGVWRGSASDLRHFLLTTLQEDGPDSFAIIYNNEPRLPGDHPTRLFCPGVPMYATGGQGELGGHTIYFYYLPAKAALQALERGLVPCLDTE